MIIDEYQQRKQERREHYEKNVKGWKLAPCSACSGSGYYDTQYRGRTPKCGSCEGTGKERVSPDEYWRRRLLDEKFRFEEAEFRRNQRG